MKRQYLFFFVILILFASTINNVSAYILPPPPPDMNYIYTENDLKTMEYSLDYYDYFNLANDIEITDTVWVPIGSASKPFSGDF